MEIIDIRKSNKTELEQLPEEKILSILEKQPWRIAEINHTKRTIHMCEVVVKNAGAGAIFRYIPKNMWDEHLYFLIAVYNSFYISCHVPHEIKTKEFFEKVIDYKLENKIFKRNERILFAELPKSLWTRELCIKLVQIDGKLLEVIPNKFKDREILEIALNNTVHAIEFFPKTCFTKKFITKLLETNSPAVKFIPHELAEKYIPALNSAPVTVAKNNEVTELTTESTDDDYSFYENFIAAYSSEVKFTPSLTKEENNLEGLAHIDFISNKLNNDTNDFFNIYYITDIHLNNKLLEKFPKPAPKQEIVNYIRQLIAEMIQGRQKEISYDNYLLIGGDVSFSFEISQIFYSELVKVWKPRKIIAVLGNHELWDYNRFGENIIGKIELNTIIEKYRTLFSELGINFLHNDLYIKNCDYIECFEKRFKNVDTTVSGSELLQMSEKEIRDLCGKSNFIVLGGLGFTGYNNMHNATNGLYRQAIESLEADLIQTHIFENIYIKIKQALDDTPVIVLTHTPKEDWTKTPYSLKWIYVNGHTHHNRYVCDESCRIYADNQIGYKKAHLTLKYFKLIRQYDIFRFLNDGIYEISRQQYIDFNYGIGIHCILNRLEYRLIMCKKDGYYLFLAQGSTKQLYLLNGGQLKSLIYKDIEYYFKNMKKYADVIQSGLRDYNCALKNISEQIKKIGGRGTIHGSIIDIDFFNHVYLNPYDGEVTAYYSPTFGEVQVYKDIPQLLKEQSPKLYYNYQKLISRSMNPKIKNYSRIESEIFFSTEQYKPSLVIKNLQFITEKNVIRSWNDEFIAGKEVDFSEDINVLTYKNLN